MTDGQSSSSLLFLIRISGFAYLASFLVKGKGFVWFY